MSVTGSRCCGVSSGSRVPAGCWLKLWLKTTAAWSAIRKLKNHPATAKMPLGEERGEELADEMCAGTVIRSPHLTRILYNFISGEGLLPFSLGDKQLVSKS